LDVPRTIPTRLPEALRSASQRAFDQASDPFNKLDYNPYIADEWAIVAAEFRALADKLERRFRALFDGKDAHDSHLQSGLRNLVQAATQPTRRAGDIKFIVSPQTAI